MRIKVVTYGKLFNLGHYENERVELTAELFDGEDYGVILTELSDKVAMLGVERATERGQDSDAAYREYGAKARLERINADIDGAQARWEKALAFLTAHSLDTADLVMPDDIPF